MEQKWGVAGSNPGKSDQNKRTRLFSSLPYVSFSHKKSIPDQKGARSSASISRVCPGRVGADPGTHSIPFYYSPHRCKFNSKRQSSTLNSIQKDKKGPRFPRQITPTRKWTHSSCISSSRESLLYTPVHPRIPAALIAAVGRVPRRWCIFYSKSTGVSHNSHMWDSRYGPP